MGNRPSCRSCRHCTPPLDVELGWCQMRRLPIHPELVGDLWCHHWTARPPRLPVMATPGSGTTGAANGLEDWASEDGGGEDGAGGNRQLSLVPMLPDLGTLAC